MVKHIFFLLVCISFSSASQAKEFEIFDGRFYNGKFYPLVDIIEWTNAGSSLPHLEFHLHSKDKKIDVSAVAGDKNGKPVVWIMYDLKFRDETICRHVLAPSHFREGMKLHAFRDDSDSDYDNIFISSEPMTGKNLKPYEMPVYKPCLDENASNKPDSLPKEVPAAIPAPQMRAPDSPSPPSPSTPPEGNTKPGKNIGVDYETQAVPFSF